VLAQLSKVAGRIYADHPEVKSVLVFGSIARGDHAGTSDVDVLIVLRDDEAGEMIGWLRRFYPYFDLPIAVDVLVYTEGEIGRRLKAGDEFMCRVWEESRALLSPGSSYVQEDARDELGAR